MKTVLTAPDGVQTVVALEDGNLITGTVQDCTPIREHAQALHKEGHHGSSDFKLAAELPEVVIETYCNLHGITFEEFMCNPFHLRAVCNDPDLRDFRVWPGRL